MIIEPLPALLVVQPTRDRYQAVVRHLREYGDGSLARDFEILHLDCYEALKSWYVRNPGRFVSLVIIGLDFSVLAESDKLLGYPELKYPVPKDFDALKYQGLLIYVFLRENGLDGDVPVLLVSDAPETKDSRRYYSFMLYPAQGACQLIYVPPGPDGPVLVAERTDALALRPLDDNQRAHWRNAHKMVIGGARRMVCLAREIERLGPGDSVVLVLGKPGVGKELVANALHRCSRRFVADDPVRAWPSTVNIAAIARNLIEVELFGHARGAYTGSVGEREGVFEYGNGSTVFLDEIGDISSEIQLKLLRVMENRRVKRLGSPGEVPVDIRIVAATNKTVEELANCFRPDFYSRVVQLCLPVPSLKERWEAEPAVTLEDDLREVFHYVVETKNASQRGPRPLDVDDAAVRFLVQLVLEYIAGENNTFSGNFRTLRALIEQAWDRAQFDGSGTVSIGHILSTVSVMRFRDRDAPPVKRNQTIQSVVGNLNMQAIEKQAIAEAMALSGGNISRAAGILGLHRDTLRRRIGEHNL